MPPIIVDPLQVPLVDTRIHSVPLDKILFDTFGRLPQRFVPLDQAPEDFIVALRDAIAPIYRPVYGDADALAWLEDDTLVIGYLSGGAAFAYPVNVLNFREIVNDVIDGVPVLITWCPLCGSGVVFNCELDGRVLIFGNTSALFQNDLVMYDHQTGSYWFQVAGEAVVGSLTGSRLKLLPAATNTWGEWRRLHPETRLLTGTADRPTEFTNRLFARERSDQAQVNRGLFAFPVDEDRLDRRLSAGAIVLTVEVGDDDVTAYPLELIGDGAVNDQVGGQPVVVFSRVNNVAAVAFSRVVGDRTLSFEFDNETRQFIDLETGSLWDGSGVAISGPHAGAQLEQLATRRAFWFSIAIAFPDIDLYLP